MIGAIARVSFRPTRIFSRAISNTSAGQIKPRHFVVYAPDKTDEGTLARRHNVRPRHLENLQPLIESGTVRLGGMLLPPEAKEEEGVTKVVGSFLIVQAPTIEEARKVIESDLYYTSGVWDSEKLVILPFMPAEVFKFP